MQNAALTPSLAARLTAALADNVRVKLGESHSWMSVSSPIQKANYTNSHIFTHAQYKYLDWNLEEQFLSSLKFKIINLPLVKPTIKLNQNCGYSNDMVY